MSNIIKNAKRHRHLLGLMALLFFQASVWAGVPGIDEPTRIPDKLSWKREQYSDPMRAEFWKRRDLDQRAVVFFGDSITDGWHGLAAAFPEMKVANRGIPGDGSAALLYRLKEDVMDLNPSAVVLLIGTNDDPIYSIKPEETAKNIENLLDRIEGLQPGTPVILCRVMPAGKKERNLGQIQKINALLDKMVSYRAHVAVCDTYAPFVNKKGELRKDLFLADQLHLNEKGYAEWKKALRPIFEKLNIKNLPEKPKETEPLGQPENS